MAAGQDRSGDPDGQGSRDGELLQVNLRAGEYAPASALASEPLMLLGEVAKLQVRADVDEQTRSWWNPRRKPLPR